MIKELTLQDQELIEELEKCFETHFEKHKIKDDLNNNFFSKYFIYIEKCNIIGFINYYDLYDRFEISYIEVLETYRNKKIGSKLIEYLLKIRKEKNIDNITLEVNINNINALKLYEKYDFKKVAIRPKYYDGVDGFLMERKMM